MFKSHIDIEDSLVREDLHGSRTPTKSGSSTVRSTKQEVISKVVSLSSQSELIPKFSKVTILEMKLMSIRFLKMASLLSLIFKLTMIMIPDNKMSIRLSNGLTRRESHPIQTR